LNPTRSFKEPVQNRIARDPEFGAALLRESIDIMLTGDMETGKAILRNYIKATVGFEKLGEATDTPAKSLIRMFGPRGNPQARNLFGVIGYLQKEAGVQVARYACPRKVPFSFGELYIMPHHYEPGVNYLRLRELAHESLQQWSRMHALYLDAVAGFDIVRDHVIAEQDQARQFVRGTDLDSEEFQDTRMFTYTQVFADNFCASGIHRATQGEVKSRNKIDGENFVALGQLCIVSFCTYWNDYLRRAYAMARGKLDPNEQDQEVVKECLRVHASEDIWGDLNYLRNSIIHNRGIANSQVNRCKIISWFKPGDLVAITPVHMRVIFLALRAYHNKLHAEQFPRHYIEIG